MFLWRSHGLGFHVLLVSSLGIVLSNILSESSKCIAILISRLSLSVAFVVLLIMSSIVYLVLGMNFNPRPSISSWALVRLMDDKLKTERFEVLLNFSNNSLLISSGRLKLSSTVLEPGSRVAI